MTRNITFARADDTLGPRINEPSKANMARAPILLP